MTGSGWSGCPKCLVPYFAPHHTLIFKMTSGIDWWDLAMDFFGFWRRQRPDFSRSHKIKSVKELLLLSATLFTHVWQRSRSRFPILQTSCSSAWSNVNSTSVWKYPRYQAATKDNTASSIFSQQWAFISSVTDVARRWQRPIQRFIYQATRFIIDPLLVGA